MITFKLKFFRITTDKLNQVYLGKINGPTNPAKQLCYVIPYAVVSHEIV